MFRQSAHEEWVLPSHYVGAHTVKYYIKFQVGLTLHLAIFPLKSKYKDTDVWNLTYCFLCFGNRLLKIEFCQFLMLYLQSTKIYNISSWIDDPISNIPLKIPIQRYRCLKLDILGLMFRKSALEEWVLPSLNVWPHILRKYTIFQVGLTIQLAIFLLKYKYKGTDVWNLTYWGLCFGNRFMKNEFCQAITLELIP